MLLLEIWNVLMFMLLEIWNIVYAAAFCCFFCCWNVCFVQISGNMGNPESEPEFSGTQNIGY
jgi:hypothetical protein